MPSDLARQLSGAWFNQLGSRLDLQADDDGRLRGTYQSPVGGVEGTHPVTGYFDADGDGPDRAVGFAVRWQSACSVTVWSGHFQVADEVLLTTWLLSGGALGPGEWRATLIGHDEFHRSPPGAEVVTGVASSVPAAGGGRGAGAPR